MKIDTSDLEMGLDEIMAMMGDATLEATQKITLDLHSELVRGSPVDEGTFRGAWEVVTPTAAFEEGIILNTTEYGPALALGHSTQAPNGWIDNAIEAVTRLKGR